MLSICSEVLPYANQGDMAKCLSREKEQRFPLGLAFRLFEESLQPAWRIFMSTASRTET